MKCLFCKQNSDHSKSIEHIIPESLGNERHVLRPGIVCDNCNNYFATKVEKHMLDMPYFKNLRFRNVIPNKKGRLVMDRGLIIHPKGGWVDMWIDENAFIYKQEDFKYTSLIASGECRSMFIPTIKEPEKNDPTISRFLAKAAVEALVNLLHATEDWIEELVGNTDLDPIREYARYNKGPFWNYSQRRIYEEEDRFSDPVNHPDPYEILHEMDFLLIDGGVLYYVLVIMGVEFVINLGERDLTNYDQWLLKHGGVSPIRRYTEYMLPRRPDPKGKQQ